MHAPRASKNTLFTPLNGVLIKKPATCSDCGKKCMIGGIEKLHPGYYTYYKQKLCRVCAMKKGVV